MAQNTPELWFYPEHPEESEVRWPPPASQWSLTSDEKHVLDAMAAKNVLAGEHMGSRLVHMIRWDESQGESWEIERWYAALDSLVDGRGLVICDDGPDDVDGDRWDWPLDALYVLHPEDGDILTFLGGWKPPHGSMIDADGYLDETERKEFCRRLAERIPDCDDTLEALNGLDELGQDTALLREWIEAERERRRSRRPNYRQSKSQAWTRIQRNNARGRGEDVDARTAAHVQPERLRESGGGGGLF